MAALFCLRLPRHTRLPVHCLAADDFAFMRVALNRIVVRYGRRMEHFFQALFLWQITF